MEDLSEYVDWENLELKTSLGTALVVRWLRLCTSTTGDAGSIPGQGTKIPHVTQCSQINRKLV